MKRFIVAPFLATSLLLVTPVTPAHAAFAEVDLVSDLAGRAASTDTRLVNPWGIVPTPLGTFRVANNGNATSEVFGPRGSNRGPTFAIPTTANLGPTGIVLNLDRRAFTLHRSGHSAPAIYIFAGQDGSLSAWNPDLDAGHAIETSRDAEAVYTGLALARARGGAFLYVANFAGGKIEVYDSDFEETDLDGDFDDPDLPDGYGPFNVQNIGGRLFVAYAKHVGGEEQPGPGLGIVNEFDTNGHLLRRVASNGPLNAPWGLARAPKNFGRFGGALLVGNFGDGRINAFNPRSGAFLGPLEDAHGEAIAIQGLWGISFAGEENKRGRRDRDDDDDGNRGVGAALEDEGGRGREGRQPESAALYFAAGIEDETHGLFGLIRPVPRRDDDRSSEPIPEVRGPVAGAGPLRIEPTENPAHLAGGGVSFRLDAAPNEVVQVRVYDTAGRLVATPATGVRGAAEVRWNGDATDGARVPTGVYFYRAQSATRTAGGRFVLLH